MLWSMHAGNGRRPDFELETGCSCEQLRRSPGPAAPSHLGHQISLQSDGVVMLGIVRAVHKGYAAAPRGLNDRFHAFRFRLQFSNVPPLETYPFGWVVAEPFPQLGT